MSDSTSTPEERIERLEGQVSDLAHFVGRLTRGMVGDKFEEFDDGDPHLFWVEAVGDEETDEPFVCGWWIYRAAPDEGEAEVAKGKAEVATVFGAEVAK